MRNTGSEGRCAGQAGLREARVSGAKGATRQRGYDGRERSVTRSPGRQAPARSGQSATTEKRGPRPSLMVLHV
jgi:hypothetical protein